MMDIHTERLLKLAAFLREKVPDAHFDLEYFVFSPPGRSGIEDMPRIAAGEQRGCGTVACAIGWCPAVFPNEWRWGMDSCGVALISSNTVGFQAAAEFFGINMCDADYLFHAHSYDHDEDGDGVCTATRHDVAQRIEEFCAGRAEKGAVK